MLLGNPLRTVSYLNPLPPSLTSLTIQGAEDGSSYGPQNRLDVSGALSKPAGLGDPGKPTASSGTSATLGSSLLTLLIPGMDLQEPSVLSSFTALTALHARGLHSRKGRELLAVLPCLRKLCYLDLSIKHEQNFCTIPYSSYYKMDSQHNPCLVTTDFERLVSGCPDLEWLSVAAMPWPEEPRAEWNEEEGRWVRPEAYPAPCSLLALQDATRLTSLSLWANQYLQDTHLAELATLTTLQSLQISGSGPFITDAGMQDLTQLTTLNRLRVEAHYAKLLSKEMVHNSVTRCSGSRVVYLDNCVRETAAKVGCVVVTYVHAGLPSEVMSHHHYTLCQLFITPICCILVCATQVCRFFCWRACLWFFLTHVQLQGWFSD